MTHDLFHRAPWRTLRLGALIAGVPVAVALLGGAGLLWRLASGPMEVTALAVRFSPITIQPGPDPQHPAGRLAWSRLFLSWHPGLRHASPELVIEARDLKVLRQDGSATLALGRAHLVVRLAPLLHGVIEPLRADIRHGQVVLRRQDDGSVDLDWPGARHTHRQSGVFSLGALSHVHIQNVTTSLRDSRRLRQSEEAHSLPAEPSGAEGASLFLAQAVLTRAPGAAMLGWVGAVNGRIGPGDSPTIDFHAAGRQPGPGLVAWDLGISPFTPAGLAGYVPHAGAWHLPVQIETHAVLAEDGIGISALGPLRQATLSLTFGRGSIEQKLDAPLQISSGSLTAHVISQGEAVSVDQASASVSLIDDVGGLTRFIAGGNFSVDSFKRAGHIDAHVTASSTPLDTAHLASIWPEILMKGARRWVTRNLTSGRGTGLHLDADLQSRTGWGGIRPTRTEAALDVTGATVHWLRPIPPAQDVSARFSFAAPDVLRIDFLGGVQPSADRRGAPRVKLDGGSMLISDLFAKDQFGTIDLALSGDLAAHLGLLAHPRLHLLSRHPLPFTHPAGAVLVTGRLTLPLTSHVENDQMHVTAEARFRDVSLDNVVLGRALTGARGRLEATEHGMSLNGQGELDGVPTTATLSERFQSREGGLREKIRAVSIFDEAALKRSHIGNESLFRGTAEMVTEYSAGFDGRADVVLSLDLEKAGLDIPVWRKSAGVAATASAHIGLRNGAIVSLDRIAAEGPDLHVEGRGLIASGKVESLVLDHFSVGRSNGDAVIALPLTDGAPVNVHIRAQDLDVAPLIHGDEAKAGITTPVTAVAGKSSLPGNGDDSLTASAKPGRPPDRPEMRWNVDIATERLFYGPKGFFGDVIAHLEHRNDRLDKALFEAKRPAAVSLALTPSPDGRQLRLKVDDLGTLLRETGMTSRLEGGTARIVGHVPDGGTGHVPPFDGVISVTPFSFRQPPAALTAATHLSVFNWSQASSERFEVQHLHLPVRVAHDVMTIHEGHLGNPALGATLEGKIGLDQGALDLRGTVVPVFGINAAPGRLPNVGKLFSPEKGGGLLAATFTVTGTASDPDLSVNPFAMLLPGVMRQLAK
ncbi:hypothetical protein C0V97_12235 [Asaia sp. W19]|uniref:AsmA-like C-terminal region-containing protein n=1 Tax=unclassified Asaia TaxID=2685023 RepID=UPI000F8EA540|nr:AsmA-like C-terminal region-containing protein [Asaia sp. W19]RUT25346.1 hypothetical protein C0V97_12235 [Asaia sp. W19]